MSERVNLTEHKCFDCDTVFLIWFGGKANLCPRCGSDRIQYRGPIVMTKDSDVSSSYPAIGGLARIDNVVLDKDAYRLPIIVGRYLSPVERYNCPGSLQRIDGASSLSLCKPNLVLNTFHNYPDHIRTLVPNEIIESTQGSVCTRAHRNGDLLIGTLNTVTVLMELSKSDHLYANDHPVAIFLVHRVTAS